MAGIRMLTFVQGLPTFYFNSIAQPPFFLHSVLPERLAQIRKIQLCYNQTAINKVRANSSELAQHQHWLHQCAFCNVNHWLEMIGKHMTGLQTIEVYAYLDETGHLPTLSDAWIIRLFKLQHGQNGLRNLKIQIYAGPDPPWIVTNGSVTVNRQSVLQLDAALQERIRKGAQMHLQSSQAESVSAP